MNIEKINLNVTDVIKLIGFVLVISSMWYDLKSDFRAHLVSHQLIEYRISKLETCNNLAVMTYEHNALIPRETQIEDDK